MHNMISSICYFQIKYLPYPKDNPKKIDEPLPWFVLFIQRSALNAIADIVITFSESCLLVCSILILVSFDYINHITNFITIRIFFSFLPLTLRWLIYLALSQEKGVFYYFFHSHIHWIY